MIFYILWNYIVGYVVIKVEGLSLEKFINLTVSQGIHLWRINRQDYTTLTACISIKGFKQLHSISHKIRCRIRIAEKWGLPFLAFRYRNRKMLVGGMLVFLAILYGFSSFVWTVDVEGTEKMKPERILEELYALGVKPGVFKPRIDELVVENQLIINIPQISWASLEIRGSRAIMRVAEAVLPPRMVDKSIPANIVAAKDGIIQKLIILEGQKLVEEGDTVKKNQLLVSGVIDHPDTTGIRYVRSMGQVMARTWYEGHASLSLKEPSKRRTGQSVEKKYVGFDKIRVPIKKEDVPYDKYELEVKEEGLFITEIYHEIEEFMWNKNLNGAKRKLEEMAVNNAKTEMPAGAKIIDKKLKYDIIEGERIEAVIYIEALEDIALQQDIDIQ